MPEGVPVATGDMADGEAAAETDEVAFVAFGAKREGETEAGLKECEEGFSLDM